jgi:hypothetical protein
MSNPARRRRRHQHTLRSMTRLEKELRALRRYQRAERNGRR